MHKTLLGAILAAVIGVANAGTILVGTDAGYAPYEYKDPETNEIVGFDMDLIKAIGKATMPVMIIGMIVNVVASNIFL